MKQCIVFSPHPILPGVVNMLHATCWQIFQLNQLIKTILPEQELHQPRELQCIQQRFLQELNLKTCFQLNELTYSIHAAHITPHITRATHLSRHGISWSEDRRHSSKTRGLTSVGTEVWSPPSLQVNIFLRLVLLSVESTVVIRLDRIVSVISSLSLESSSDRSVVFSDSKINCCRQQFIFRVRTIWCNQRARSVIQTCNWLRLLCIL